MQKNKLKLLLCISLSLFLFDFFALLFSTSIFNYFALHSMASVTSFLVAYFFTKKKWGLCLPYIQTIFITFFGPYGTFMSLYSILFYALFLKNKKSQASLLEELMPKNPFDSTIELYERLKFGLERNLAQNPPLAFQDVMRVGSETEKRYAIEKILRYFRPEFSESLKIGLRDKNHAIRVLAATAIAAIEQRYYQEYLELDEKVRFDPENPEKLKKFALHLQEYAAAEIIDDERKEKLLQTALEIWQRHEEQVWQDAERKLSVAQIYLILKNPNKAIEGLDQENKEEIKLLIEGEFALKNYSLVRELSKEDPLWTSV
jgi:hypothetical protein